MVWTVVKTQTKTQTKTEEMTITEWLAIALIITGYSVIGAITWFTLLTTGKFNRLSPFVMFLVGLLFGPGLWIALIWAATWAAGVRRRGEIEAARLEAIRLMTPIISKTGPASPASTFDSTVPTTHHAAPSQAPKHTPRHSTSPRGARHRPPRT